jgi:hypothetical protein
MMPVVERCNRIPLTNWSFCPDTSVCVGGDIAHCHNHYILVEGKECVVSEEAQETVATMIQLLQTWTIADLCNPDGNPYAVGRSTENRPFFGYSQLKGELEVGIDWTTVLKKMPDDFVLDAQSDGNLRVALHESHRVALPSKCVAKKIFRSLLEGVASAVLVVIGWTFALSLSILSVYWSLFYEIPLMTLIFTVVVPIFGRLIMAVFRRLMFRRQLELDRVSVREEVYKHLKAKSDQYRPIILVRDRILFDPFLPYHSNAAMRKRILDKVWPRVVKDVAKDNHVTSTRMMVSGVSRECWKWSDRGPMQ